MLLWLLHGSQAEHLFLLVFRMRMKYFSRLKWRSHNFFKHLLLNTHVLHTSHKQPLRAVFTCCLCNNKHLHELHPCFLAQWFIFIFWSNWIRQNKECFSFSLFFFLQSVLWTERTLLDFGKEKHLPSRHLDRSQEGYTIELKNWNWMKSVRNGPKTYLDKSNQVIFFFC